MNSDGSQIQRFYDGKSILLTGVTGFIGKLILEKLLRSCNLKKVYVLVRPKKGKSIQERLEQLFKSQAFDPLKEQSPNFKEKVYGIEGGLELKNIGLSEVDMKLLIENVNIIINCGATVRFDQSLKTATCTNVRSVKYLLEIAKEMKDMKVFVQVSTAYSFCPNKEIDEVVYRPRIKAEELLKIVESWNEDVVDDITKSLIGPWPNTYTFTKSVAEELVSRETTFPTTIVRPSIVGNSIQEPLPGWVDTFQGVAGLLTATGLGIIRVFPGKPNCYAEFMPADYSVNCIISSAWGAYRFNQEQKINAKECIVYNNTCEEHTRRKWGSLKQHLKDMENYATVEMIWYPFMFWIENKYVFLILHFLLHLAPAHAIDFLLGCLGKEPRLKKIYATVDSAAAALEYFTKNEWKFGNKNTKDLWDNLTMKDKQMFYFMTDSSYNHEEYMKHAMMGCRLYLVHEPLDLLPKARRKYFALKYVHFTVLCILILFFVKFLFYITSLL